MILTYFRKKNWYHNRYSIYKIYLTNAMTLSVMYTFKNLFKINNYLDTKKINDLISSNKEVRKKKYSTKLGRHGLRKATLLDSSGL